MNASKSLARLRMAYPVSYFGYWRAKEEINWKAIEAAQSASPHTITIYPWPVISQKPDLNILENIAKVETFLSTAQNGVGGRMSFMGTSTSRITGEVLGACEYFVCDDEARVRYAWPADYASHYLALGVAPDPDFSALINTVLAKIPDVEAGPTQDL